MRSALIATIIAFEVAGVVPQALAQTVACQPQPPVNRCSGPACTCEDASHYTNIFPPGKNPSSQVFCAQNTLWKRDPTNPDAPFVYLNNGWEVDGTGSCYSNHQVSASKIPAFRAEVRGWIAYPPTHSAANGDRPAPSNNTLNDEVEFPFYISLDTGWSAAPGVEAAGVVAINTLDKINRYLPAANIIHFGGRNVNGPNGPQEAWGGLGTAILHVEIDAWSLGRGGETFGADYQNVTNHQTILGRPLLVNWVQAEYTGTTPSKPIWWPFDLPILHGADVTNPYWYFPPLAGQPGANRVALVRGDYVRLVGTLWEDGPHIPGDTDWDAPTIPANLAQKCWWEAYQHTHGWAELHSVDYLVKIEPPLEHHVVSDYVLCADGSNTGSTTQVDEWVYPPLLYPFSHVTAVNTVFDTTPRSNLSGQNPLPVAWYGGNSFRAYQQAAAGGGNPGTAKFSIETVISCSPSCQDRCGDDGCGGTCSDNCPLTAGHACPSGGGACTCSAAGWGLCSTTGGDCRQTSTCPSCPLSLTAPSSMGVTRGSSFTYSIAVSGGGGPQNVLLSMAGVPAGVTASFSPLQVTVSAGSPQGSVLTLSASTGADPGTNDSSITASPAAGSSNCAPVTNAAPLTVRCPSQYVACDGICYHGSICP